MSKDIVYLNRTIGAFRYSAVPLKTGVALVVTNEIRYAVTRGAGIEASDTGLVCHPVGHPELPIMLDIELVMEQNPLALCRYCGEEIGVDFAPVPDPIGTGHAHRSCVEADIPASVAAGEMEPDEGEQILRVREETTKALEARSATHESL